MHKGGVADFFKSSGQKVHFENYRIFFSLNIFETYQTYKCNHRYPTNHEVGKISRHSYQTSGDLALLQKLNDRLQGWKSRCLSRAGRINLVKAVINSIPIFHMQLERLPRKVHKEFDKAVRRCVGGGEEQRRVIHFTELGNFVKTQKGEWA